MHKIDFTTSFLRWLVWNTCNRGRVSSGKASTIVCTCINSIPHDCSICMGSACCQTTSTVDTLKCNHYFPENVQVEDMSLNVMHSFCCKSRCVGAMAACWNPI